MVDKNLKKAVVILSGGMDSSLCSYIAKASDYEIITVHFNYGQRTEDRELEAFRAISKEVKAIKKIELNLDFFKEMGGSALTDESIEVPTGGITDDIPVTYVPYRNGIFLSIAGAIAEREGAEALFIGVVEEDSSGYPDCREEFIESMKKTINLGTKPDTYIDIITPLVNLKKVEIVKEALKYNLPLELTWSCYQNSKKACGICDSCRLRLNGFRKAGIEDALAYV